VITHAWASDYSPDGAYPYEALFEQSQESQWDPETAIDWSQRPALSGVILEPGMFAVHGTSWWQSLPPPTRQRLYVALCRFALSQILHAEQGALMVAAQLVLQLTNMRAKQVADEARHTHVLARYIQLLGPIDPVAPTLRRLMDELIDYPRWEVKFVGTQIIVESRTMTAFHRLADISDDALLTAIVQRAEMDEARHVALGLMALTDHIRGLPETDRRTFEEYALATVRRTFERSLTPEAFEAQRPIYVECGVDADEAIAVAVAAPDYADFQRALYRKHVTRNLERVGLLTDRTRDAYAEMGILPERVGSR